MNCGFKGIPIILGGLAVLYAIAFLIFRIFCKEKDRTFFWIDFGLVVIWINLVLIVAGKILIAVAGIKECCQ
jgi:hypothetical protein